jgi:hypothetical protein
MPGDYAFRKDVGFVVTRFWGVVTDADFTALYKALLADEQFEPGMAEISDLRLVTSSRVSAAALTKSKLVSANVSGRTVIVAPRTLPFGLSRMYEGLAATGPQEVRVFRTLEGAAGSLSLEPQELERILA